MSHLSALANICQLLSALLNLVPTRSPTQTPPRLLLCLAKFGSNCNSANIAKNFQVVGKLRVAAKEESLKYVLEAQIVYRIYPTLVYPGLRNGIKSSLTNTFNAVFDVEKCQSLSVI